MTRGWAVGHGHPGLIVGSWVSGDERGLTIRGFRRRVVIEPLLVRHHSCRQCREQMIGTHPTTQPVLIRDEDR